LKKNSYFSRAKDEKNEFLHQLIFSSSNERRYRQVFQKN